MLIKHLQVCSVHQIGVLKQVWLKTTNFLIKSSIVNLEMAPIKGPSLFSVCSLFRHGLNNTVLGKSSFVSELFSTWAYPGHRAVPFHASASGREITFTAVREDGAGRPSCPERLLSEASPHKHAANKHRHSTVIFLSELMTTFSISHRERLHYTHTRL